MALQYFNTSFFKPNDVSISKVSYEWQLATISQVKSSNIHMCISPSSRPHANTINNKALLIVRMAGPPANTMEMIKDRISFKMERHQEFKVISPYVDAKNKLHELKEYTRRALLMISDPAKTMKLIDAIQRLGVGHYFEEEINTVLINKLPTHVLPDEDLYTTALLFRLQRQNGIYTNPGDVFQKFMDVNGKVKESVTDDIEGLLSLYEASYLGTNGEYFLSHAKEFTTRQLHKFVSQLSPKLQIKVVESLELPRHMRIERLEARRYIAEYGNEDDHNPIILEFAKLDYNHVQSLIQMEQVEVTSWWRQLGLANKTSFIRDRHVECFLWTIGLLPEPKYTSCRIVLAKTIAILLVIDDIYDTYGSYNDLVLFTKAIQRWDLNEVERLPEYMKLCYMALYNTNDEICDKVLKEDGLNVQPFLRKTWIDMVEAYMVQVEWTKQRTIPNLKDYIDNGVITSGTYMVMVHLFVLISGGVAKENIIDHLITYPKFFTLAGTMLRLWDDLGTSKEEEKRGEVISSIQLLMKEKNIICEEEAIKHILQIIHGFWKDLNAELITPDMDLWPMIRVALNISRASQAVYHHNEDSYLSNVQNQVQTLFYEPIDMQY
uniref:probable terpene synthase 11 n=1 Tax=Erigeron canadensis TaxID=72917 RepID=UPI001CB9AF7B|nr:probable terpene synthase 11 [Erigeron canadensis]